MSVVVKEVRTRRQRKQFLELPWTLYRDQLKDPNWIPPLRMNQKEMVGFSHHPFYDANEGQAFLATDGDQVVGRVMAILNNGHNERYNERRGFFGFFESVDDRLVSSALFDAVRQWFARRDIHELRGPTNPSLNYEVGLLIDGFDSPPTFMMTYNPPYYAGLLEGYGFQKTHDLYAFGGTIDMLYKLDKKLFFIAQESQERFGIELRPLDTKRFAAEIGMFLEIYNASLAGTWGFVPLSAAEIRHLSAGLKRLILPELTTIALVKGKPIGAVFGLPDYNPRIREINGRLFPFGFMKLLNRRQPFQRMRVISANVLPEYQAWGVGIVLLKGLVPALLASGIQEVEFSWVLESNNLSRRSLERGGALLQKTFRVYDYVPPFPSAPRGYPGLG